VKASHKNAVFYTYLFLLHIKVVNDDTNEEIQCKERAKYNEEDKE
jgi:hypothetical protein